MTDHAKNRPLFIKKGRNTLLLEPASGRYVPTTDVQKKFSNVVKWRPDKSPPMYSMSCIKTVVVISKSNLGNVQCPGSTPFAHIYPHVNRTHNSFYLTCRFAIEPLFD